MGVGRGISGIKFYHYCIRLIAIYEQDDQAGSRGSSEA